MTLTTAESRNLIVLDAAAQDAALAQARGCYQRALLIGDEPLSGAGLRGEARRWSGVYARSRAAVLARVGDWTEARGPRGRRVLVLGASRLAEVVAECVGVLCRDKYPRIYPSDGRGPWEI